MMFLLEGGKDPVVDVGADFTGKGGTDSQGDVV